MSINARSYVKVNSLGSEDNSPIEESSERQPKILALFGFFDTKF